MQRSAQWLVCAAILFLGGAALAIAGLVLGPGLLGGALLLVTGVGALLVARRFRKLEHASTLRDFDQQMDRFW